MGRVHTYTATASSTRTVPVLRVLDLVAGTLLLVLAVPLIAVLALAVRRSSHGPVLHRSRGLDARGRTVELLSFRTAVDGARTSHHERLRAVVGADDGATLTGVGRLMRATRTHRLPRLVNVVRGETSLFSR